jgi:hypothetical protein
MNHGNDHTTIWGTLSGTALGIAASISSFDIIKTIILGAIGASVSFGVSLFWNKVANYFKQQQKD